ncbi:MAG: division/cell wall cluster transcriptional repressor MraZ [Bacteroidota bacterium]|nr:division/cell wall cluster transcriptional repressor MraZ [Bacteroidota bacterium]
MTSFIGDFTGRVDAKGRVILPAPLKKQLLSKGIDSFVIKRDIFEKCLILYTADEWKRQNEIIRSKINPYNKKHKVFLREFYRNTSEVQLDGNNRILMPADLINYADIEKDVYFSGQDRKIEIWSKDNYLAAEESPEDFAQLAEDIMGGEQPEL